MSASFPCNQKPGLGDLGAQLGIERRDSALIELVGSAGLAELLHQARRSVGGLARLLEQGEPLLGGDGANIGATGIDRAG